jgi:hypothetical protein
MTQIITIVAGKDWDGDDLDPVIAQLVQMHLIQPFADGEITRPAIVVEGIEVQCALEDYRQVCAIIQDAGFQVVGGPDS